MSAKRDAIIAQADHANRNMGPDYGADISGLSEQEFKAEMRKHMVDNYPRSAVQIVYRNLFVKMHRASREENHDRYVELDDLMNRLECEFQAEVEAERDSWNLPVVVYSER